MKNSILSIVMILGLSYKAVAQQGYQDAPPPRYNQQFDKRYQGGNGQVPSRPPIGMASGFDYDNRYFKFSAGSASVSDSSFGGDRLTYNDTTFLPLTFAVGVEHGMIASELELFIASNNIDTVDGLPDDGSVTALGLNANVLFRGFITPIFYLYGGGGLGLMSVNVNDGLYNSANGSAFAIQGILGGEVRPNQRMGIFMEYKLLTSLGLRMEDNNFFAEYDYKYTNSSLNVGMRIYY